MIHRSPLVPIYHFYKAYVTLRLRSHLHCLCQAILLQSSQKHLFLDLQYYIVLRVLLPKTLLLHWLHGRCSFFAGPRVPIDFAAFLWLGTRPFMDWHWNWQGVLEALPIGIEHFAAIPMNDFVLSAEGEVVLVVVSVGVDLVPLAVADDDLDDEAARNVVVGGLRTPDRHELHIVEFVGEDIGRQALRNAPDGLQQVLLLALIELHAQHLPLLGVDVLMHAQVDGAALRVQEPAEGLLQDVYPGFVEGERVVFVLDGQVLGLLDDLLVDEGCAATHQGHPVGLPLGHGLGWSLLLAGRHKYLLYFLLVLVVYPVGFLLELLLAEHLQGVELSGKPLRQNRIELQLQVLCVHGIEVFFQLADVLAEFLNIVHELVLSLRAICHSLLLAGDPHAVEKIQVLDLGLPQVGLYVGCDTLSIFSVPIFVRMCLQFLVKGSEGEQDRATVKPDEIFNDGEGFRLDWKLLDEVDEPQKVVGTVVEGFGIVVLFFPHELLKLAAYHTEQIQVTLYSSCHHIKTSHPRIY